MLWSRTLLSWDFLMMCLGIDSCVGTSVGSLNPETYVLYFGIFFQNYLLDFFLHIVFVLSFWNCYSTFGPSELVLTVQFSHSVVSDFFATPWTTARQASLSITNYRSLPKSMCLSFHFCQSSCPKPNRSQVLTGCIWGTVCNPVCFDASTTAVGLQNWPCHFKYNRQ